MDETERARSTLGNEPPLDGTGRSGPPDRREISARWLSGAVLTGLTSTLLMGAALLAALDGREQLATPPEVARMPAPERGLVSGEEAKSDRLAPPRQVVRPTDRRRMEVSTLTRAGDRDVVRTMPFVQIKMNLAAGYATTRDYPPFDPLKVFAEDGAATQTATTGLIYGAKVESEVSLRTVDFPVATAAFEEAGGLSADEVEEVVRQTGSILTDGDVQVASLHYIDPQRFGVSPLTPASIAASYGVRIVQENAATFARSPKSEVVREFSEDIIPFNADRNIADAFTESGYGGGDAAAMAEALGKILNARRLKAGTVLRVGIESRGDYARIVRTSVYGGKDHVLTIALNDRDQFVAADEPEYNPAVASAFDGAPPPPRKRDDLPTVYDGIYRAAYSYGMSKEMTGQLVKLLASDVDYQSRLNSSDRLEVFFSQPGEDDLATPDSELLYVRASFGGQVRSFYRYQLQDGTIDYFDENGRSARQFLLRNPVPNGRFNNGFGMRRHPILGYSRLHSGVDWTAPRGTPIIATGNGVVEEAGWSNGFGRHTVVRHANGYETSYSHQSGIARGVVPGARVRQGQVIGYVGSTGLSTGNHLHYELIVNGAKVDPMRVRLPNSRTLKDDELKTFIEERDRINELLQDKGKGTLRMAEASQ